MSNEQLEADMAELAAAVLSLIDTSNLSQKEHRKAICDIHDHYEHRLSAEPDEPLPDGAIWAKDLKEGELWLNNAYNVTERSSVKQFIGLSDGGMRSRFLSTRIIINEPETPNTPVYRVLVAEYRLRDAQSKENDDG